MYPTVVRLVLRYGEKIWLHEVKNKLTNKHLTGHNNSMSVWNPENLTNPSSKYWILVYSLKIWQGSSRGYKSMNNKFGGPCFNQKTEEMLILTYIRYNLEGAMGFYFLH